MSIRTMIVDDEPLAIERLQMLCAREPRLTLCGTASDGEAALRLIEALKPDLVMLDIAMPASASPARSAAWACAPPSSS